MLNNCSIPENNVLKCSGIYAVPFRGTMTTSHTVATVCQGIAYNYLWSGIPDLYVANRKSKVTH